jgi:hypothetical protein
MKILRSIHSFTVSQFHSLKIINIGIVFILTTAFLVSCNREEVRPKVSDPILTIENRTAEPCGPPNILGCVKDTFYEVINFSFFNCPLGIEYERYICPGGGYYFGYFKVFAEDCDSFDTWINNCMSSPAAFEACMAFLNAEIMEAVILVILNDENPASPTITSTFYQAACNQWCLETKYDPRGTPTTILGKLRCSDACCEHQYVVRKINGEWIIISESKTQVGGIGCNYQFQVESCEGPYTSPCINECQ